MIINEFIYAQEQNAHNDIIETLNAQAFGSSRFTRAAHLIREAGGHDHTLSFVALKDNLVIGSVRQTHIYIDQEASLLLGPIVISPHFKNTGIGKNLMNMAINAAKQAALQSILLVGDQTYYSRFGFKVTTKGHIIMPAPVDPNRLLGLELTPNSLDKLKGIVRHKNCFR